MSADWLIDLGHTRIKWARAGVDGAIESVEYCGLDQPAELERCLSGASGSRIWLSAQSHPAAVQHIEGLARDCGLQLQTVTTGSIDLPVKPAYAGLGSDRWLAVQAPWRQCQQALVVIDCGTALTVDVVDDQGRHLGGWIMAGLGTARDGLLSGARGLPREAAEPEAPEQPATATPEAIAAGTLLQLAGSIERAVDAAAQALGRIPAIWLTGGDAGAIIPITRIDARHDENLVLHGLSMAVER